MRGLTRRIMAGFSLPALQGAVAWLWLLAAVGGVMAITGSVLSLAITRHIATQTRQAAEAELSDAEAAATRARAAAAQARQELADARAHDHAGAQRDAETARRLARLYQPFALNDRQEARLVARCRDAAGARYDASADGGDSQSFEFLQHLRPLLRRAGWVEVDWTGDAAALTQPPHAELGDTAAPAVILLTHAGAATALLDSARALRAALLDAGVLAIQQTADWDATGHALRADVLHLVVSRRAS
ncbi:MAG: hypothetical protein ACRYGC_06385 [Janthinobacterium lividum]